MDTIETISKFKPRDLRKSAIKRNLINGFCSIVIFHANKQVLVGFPDDEQDPKNYLNDTLTTYLRDKRIGENRNLIRRKKT